VLSLLSVVGARPQFVKAAVVSRCIRSSQYCDTIANVKMFFTCFGKMFFIWYGKVFFMCLGKHFFTLHGKQIFIP
jgi:hypothetical protein